MLLASLFYDINNYYPFKLSYGDILSISGVKWKFVLKIPRNLFSIKLTDIVLIPGVNS